MNEISDAVEMKMAKYEIRRSGITNKKTNNASAFLFISYTRTFNEREEVPEIVQRGEEDREKKKTPAHRTRLVYNTNDEKKKFLYIERERERIRNSKKKK